MILKWKTKYIQFQRKKYQCSLFFSIINLTIMIICTCYSYQKIVISRVITNIKSIQSNQRRFMVQLVNLLTCFYKMFCCFQHFSWSNIVKLIMVLLTYFAFQFYRNGLWFTFIGFGRVFTTEFTSAGPINIAMNR